MGRIRFNALFLLLLFAFVLPVLGAGHVEVIVAFDIEAGELTEGVTVDADGNVFVSLTPLAQVVKVAAGGDTAEPFGAVTGLAEGDLGMLGVAAAPSGDIYGAVVSTSPDANGVWKFDAETGAEERVPGSESIAFPNAISFGENGDVYMTDSVGGSVWIAENGGSAEVWIQDPLLEGNMSLGFGIPLGANGIDVRDGVVYVGVIETASIVTIPIMDDGSAGEAALWAKLPSGNHVDGIILDAEGNVIVAAPTSNLVLRVHTDGTMDALATVSDGLDAPASVAYYEDADGNASIYTVNFSIVVNPARRRRSGTAKN